MTTMKLQKLVYYCQAWHLVWEGKPLFDEPIRAWKNGPVVYELFDLHRGKYSITSADLTDGNPAVLTDNQRDVIDDVLSTYAPMTATQLSLLTHEEDPWRLTRAAHVTRPESSDVIALDVIIEYYTRISQRSDSVTRAEDANFPPWTRPAVNHGAHD